MNIGTSISGFLGGLGNFGSSLVGGISDLAQGVTPLANLGIGIASAINQPAAPTQTAVANQLGQPSVRPTGALAAPGGAPYQTAGIGGDLIEWGLDALGSAWDMGLGGGNGNGGTMSNGLTIKPMTSQTRRFPSIVQGMVTTPSGNTRVVTYKNMGSPVLYSGDLAACKRVKRISRRVRRAAGGR